MADNPQMDDAHELDPQHQLFIDKYFELTFNGTKAAIAAGYSRKTARQQASRLLTNVNIRTEIDRRLGEQGMGVNEVLARLADHARGDMRDFASVQSPRSLAKHPNGNLIKKFKRTITTDKDGNSEERIELELYDAQDALVQLGRYHKLFTERVDMTTQGDKIIPILKTGMDLDEL